MPGSLRELEAGEQKKFAALRLSSFFKRGLSSLPLCFRQFANATALLAALIGCIHE
jgi:hypothetical protein